MGVDPLFRAILWELMGVAWELKALLSLHQPGCRILGNAQISIETVTAHGRKNQLSTVINVISFQFKYTPYLYAKRKLYYYIIHIII